MKRSLVFIFFLVTVSVFAQQNKPISWSMALQNVKSRDLVAFSGPVRSWTGEEFRLIINPKEMCYCYVVYESPDGDDVTILYSGLLKGGEAWYSPPMELTNPPGSESLYVVVSREEQKALTQSIASYSAKNTTALRTALMDEILQLRSVVSKYNAAPEVPVIMGGVSRGAPEKSMGVEYSGLGTYVKTISIEH